MSKLKVAVIGVGRLGSVHARIYKSMEDVELVGVCDVDRGKNQEVSKEVDVEGFLDYRDLLGRVNAVSIVVPTKNHYGIAKEFLKNNVHVLIEKPITQTVEEADELLELAKMKNLTLAVGHVERFNAAVEAVRKIKGDIKFIECHRLGPFSPHIKDVGVVLDLMIHDIDIILWLINSPIKKIDAVGVKILSAHEDIANARISFENDAVCNITASRVTPYTIRKIRIFQPNAYISLDYVKQDAEIYQRSLGRIISQKIDITKEQPLQKELASFIRCIRSKEKPIASGEEGRQALKVALDIVKQIKL